MKSRCGLVLVLIGTSSAATAQMSISGQVVMKNGSPPPELVSIERFCGGQRFVETKTDSKGRFTFTVVGSHDSGVIDASVSQANERGGVRAGAARGTYDLSGCDVRAVLPGFKSEPRRLGFRSVFDSPDIGVIVLYPMDKRELARISFTSLNAPPKAKKALELASKELKKQKPNLGKAVKLLETAVEIHPHYAEAWSALGQTRLRLKQNEDAREALRRAIEADKNYLPPYMPLIRLEMSQAHWKSVAGLSAHTLKLDPRTTEARFCQAVANLYLGEIEQAKESALAVQSSADAAAFPLTHHLLGVIYSQQRNIRQAADEFRTFLRLQPNSPIADHVRQQLAEWEKKALIQ